MKYITIIFIIINQLFKYYNTLLHKASLVSLYNYPQTFYSPSAQGIKVKYADDKEQIIKEDRITDEAPKGYQITESPTVFLPNVCEIFLNRHYFWFFNYRSEVVGEQTILSSSFSAIFYSSNYYIIYTTEEPPSNFIKPYTYSFNVNNCVNWTSLQFTIGTSNSIASGISCSLSERFNHLCLVIDSYEKTLIFYYRTLEGGSLVQKGSDYVIRNSLELISVKGEIHKAGMMIFWGLTDIGETYAFLTIYNEDDYSFKEKPTVKVLENCIDEIFYVTFLRKKVNNNSYVLCCPRDTSIQCNSIIIDDATWIITSLYQEEITWLGDKRAISNLIMVSARIPYAVYILEIHNDITNQGTYADHFKEMACPVINPTIPYSTPHDLIFITDQTTYDPEYYYIIFLDISGMDTAGIIKHDGKDIEILMPYHPNKISFLSIESEGNGIAKYYISHKMGIGSVECQLMITVHVDCYSNCLLCIGVHDHVSMNCLTCQPGYEYNSNTRNCIMNPPPSSKHYIGKYGDYYPCFSTCQTCSMEGDSRVNNCLSCIDDYYLMIETKNCIHMNNKDIPGYYADPITMMIYPCYNTCNECDGIGSLTEHHCTICNGQRYLISEMKNCYLESEYPENYYLDTLTTPYQYKKCNNNCRSCKDNTSCLSCIANYYMNDNQCVNQCPPLTYKYKDARVLNCIKSSVKVLNECYDLYEPSNSNNTIQEIKTTILPQLIILNIITKDISLFADNNSIIIGPEYVLHIYNSLNFIENNEKSIQFKLIQVNIDNRLQSLASQYNIPKDDIVIVKIDKNSTTLPINQLELLFYDKNNNQLLFPDNYCNSISIIVISPILYLSTFDFPKANYTAQQGYDSFDVKEDLFNDICTPFYSEENTDVLIEDRRSDYFQNNTFCPMDCSYKSSNLKEMNTVCDCKTDTDSDFKKTFSSISTMNFKVIKCYQLVFDKDILIQNIGFRVMTSLTLIITLLFVLMIAIEFKTYSRILQEKTIITKPKINANTDANTNTITNSKGIDNKSRLKVCTFGHLQYIHTNDAKLNHKSTLISIKNFDKGDNCQVKEYYGIDGLNKNFQELEGDNLGKPMNNKNIFMKFADEYKKTIVEKKSHNFIRIYYDFIQYNHPFWRGFITKNSLNLGMMNMITFFNGIIINCGFNALFFTSVYIQKKYINKTIYTFLISLPKCIYSFIVGFVFGMLLTTITSSQRDIYNYLMKQNQKKMKENNYNNTTDQDKQEQEKATIEKIEIIKPEKISKFKKGDPKTINKNTVFNDKNRKNDYRKIIKVIKIKTSIFHNKLLHHLLLLVFYFSILCRISIFPN